MADIIGITDILSQKYPILSILKTDMDHHYSRPPTCSNRPKLSETCHVLQKEDEHRALSNADTKYDAPTYI